MLELLSELTLRALRTDICALPLVCLLFFWQSIRKRRQSAAHIAGTLLLCLYLSGVLSITGIGKPFGFLPRISLIPFVDMVKGPIDTALNVLLFLPLGIFLPLLYAEFESLRRTALAAFCLSFSIELIQMFGLGITDINDLMTNTAGACLGYLLSEKWRAHMPPDAKRKLQAAQGASVREALPLAALLFVSCMFLAPAWLR